MWFATSNKHKLDELKGIIEHLKAGFKLRSLSELAAYHAPEENGKSFLENATIKAKFSRGAVPPKSWVVAEDSGLVVPGLDGMPGIHSARYAGPKATDSENTAKLLKMLQLRKVKDRSAAFVCTAVLIKPDGELLHAEGRLEGQIIGDLKGKLGFGYDPVFVPRGESLTLAELGPGFKQQHSHRAQAFTQLFNSLETST